MLEWLLNELTLEIHYRDPQKWDKRCDLSAEFIAKELLEERTSWHETDDFDYAIAEGYESCKWCIESKRVGAVS